MKMEALNHVHINVEENASPVLAGVIAHNANVSLYEVSAEKAGQEMPILERRG